MPSLRVAIADDELLARRRLARLLAEVPDVELVAECADVDELLARLRSADPPVHVVLLDVHMPGLTGLDALGMLPGGVQVIFCTAHAEHAVRAYEEGVLDYLLKPIELPRLVKALTRATPSRPEPRKGAEVARLAVETRAGIVLVDPRNVTHAMLDGALVKLVTTDAEYVTDFTLQELEGRLSGPGFVRVHRRAIVNLEHVARLEPTTSGGFVARTSRGHAVEVSRQSARDLRVRLGLRRP